LPFLSRPLACTRCSPAARSQLSRQMQVEEKKDAAAVKEAKKPEPKKELTKEEKEKAKKAAEKVH
jgi:hypothetical protein